MCLLREAIRKSTWISQKGELLSLRKIRPGLGQSRYVKVHVANQQQDVVFSQ